MLADRPEFSSLLQILREKLSHGLECNQSGFTGRQPVVFALQLNQLHILSCGEAYRPDAFASFTGIFIDLYDEESGRYGVLYQPLAIAIKAPGQLREVEFSPEEIHERFENLSPAKPVIPMEDVLRSASFESWTKAFTFNPE